MILDTLLNKIKKPPENGQENGQENRQESFNANKSTHNSTANTAAFLVRNGAGAWRIHNVGAVSAIF